MGGFTTGGWFSGSGISRAWKGTDASLKTQTYTDPLKQAIATPISEFLADRVGKERTYPGEKLDLFDLSKGEDLNQYSKFFEETVANPEIARFRNEFMPELQESFAGSLRGSGRFASEEDAVNKFATGLAEVKGKDLYDYASNVNAAREAEYVQNYNAWMQSLPEYSPVLQGAMNFLQEGTGTGTTSISYIDPGKTGLWGSILSLIGGFVGGGNVNRQASGMGQSGGGAGGGGAFGSSGGSGAATSGNFQGGSSTSLGNNTLSGSYTSNTQSGNQYSNFL